MPKTSESHWRLVVALLVPVMQVCSSDTAYLLLFILGEPPGLLDYFNGQLLNVIIDMFCLHISNLSAIITITYPLKRYNEKLQLSTMRVIYWCKVA